MDIQQLQYIMDTTAPLIVSISIITMIFSFSIRKIKKIPKQHNEQLKEALPENAHGIIFGKFGKKGKNVIYSPSENEGSVGVFSASGTGKTSAVGIPTLRSWSGTSFTIDISGDICKNCPTMKNKLIYEPENPNTIPYNIFGTIDNLQTREDQNEALEQLAFLLIPDNAQNDNAKFFDDNGRKILTASLIAFYHKGFDFIKICEKIVGSNYLELFKDIDESQNQDAVLYINSFEGASEQNTAGCKQACDDAIKLFATNGKIKKSIHRPKNGEDFIQPDFIENHNIFVIVDDPKLTLYSPLLNIITSQMMQYISNRKVEEKSKNILLFLDEYASLKIEASTILEALRKYRKRRCRVMIMTQNLADLNLLYGEETTRALMSNLRFKVLLGGLAETDSQKYFAELIGYRDTKKRSTSKSASSITKTESDEKEYVIAPADLDRQGKDTVILIHPDNEGYMLLEKNYYFKK